MTEHHTPGAAGLLRRRRRARLLTAGFTVTLAGLALGLGSGELSHGGLSAFLTRPPGVGATPALSADDTTPSPSGTPAVPAATPAAAPASPLPRAAPLRPVPPPAPPRRRRRPTPSR